MRNAAAADEDAKRAAADAKRAAERQRALAQGPNTNKAKAVAARKMVIDQAGEPLKEVHRKVTQEALGMRAAQKELLNNKHTATLSSWDRKYLAKVFEDMTNSSS